MRAWIVASYLVPAALAAQQDSPPTAPVNLSRADEIRYAKSAAPADISKDAKVWVLENGHFVIAQQGTSNVVCEVARNTATSFEPQCGDTEADSTILAIFRFRTEERIAGKTPDEIKADVADGIASGRFHPPQRPALVYMESASQVLTDATGNNRSHFMPHLMVFYPGMTISAMGIVGSKSPKRAGRRAGGDADVRAHCRHARLGGPDKESVTDDLALVERFLRGRGEDAFRALYHAHTAALYALALRLTGGDRAEAEDLVQESWIRALTALRTFRARSALRSWLCGVLVNVHRGRIRADWRIVDGPYVEPIADTTSPDDAIDLERAIAALPDGAREIYVLHDVHGYTHREIAELMGVVEGTSKSQLNRARSLLRSSLP